MIRPFLVGLACLLTPVAATAADFAIVHAEAWPLTGQGKVSDATIVVRDGRIVSVTAKGVVPDGYAIVDAAGRTVTPGLMNAATHLGLVETGTARETNDKATSSAALGAAFDVQYGLNSNSVLLPEVRADGLTRAVSYPAKAGSAPFMGQAATITLTERGEILERAQAGLYVEIGSTTLAEDSGSRSAQWQLLRKALADAGRYKVDRPDQPISREDAEALKRVLAGTQVLVILTHRESDIRQAIRLAKDFTLRVAIMGGAEAWRCADVLKDAGIPVILDPMDNLPISFDQIGARLDNAARLAKAGVTVAFYASGNTIYLSYNAGIGMRQAAGMAVANGLPYETALSAISANPARIFGLDKAYGTLSPQKEADLVIWDGDPLEPTTYPWKVFVRGEAAALITRQTRLRDRYSQRTELPAVYSK